MAVHSLDTKKLAELRNLVDDMTNAAVLLHGVREQAVATGLPRPLLIRAVTMLADDENASIDGIIAQLKTESEKQAGQGSFDLDEVRRTIDEMVKHEQDLRHFRFVSRSYNVDVFVINKLVELRQKSPLDKGEGLIKELIMLAGVGIPESSAATASQAEPEPAATTRTRDNRHTGNSSSGKSMGQLFVDILLGLGIGVGAILLLN